MRRPNESHTESVGSRCESDNPGHLDRASSAPAVASMKQAAAVRGTDVGETTIACHDGGRVEVHAESMWPVGSCLEFWATLDVIGPRQVCVRRIASSEVRHVVREGGAIWST